MSEQNISPFGAYLGKFLDAFEILDEHKKGDFDDDLDAWEVSVMVKARTPEEAYEKIVEIANRDNKQYKGELDGVSIDWTFVGVTELDPIFHDPSIDSDFIYLEHHEINLGKHSQPVREKRDLCDEIYRNNQ